MDNPNYFDPGAQDTSGILKANLKNVTPNYYEAKNHKQEINPEDSQLSNGCQAKIFPQLLAAFAALVGAFSFGCGLGYSAVAMPKLRHDPHFPQTTEDDISWMSAIITVGALCACAPTGFAVDKFGRRKMLLFLAIPFLAGWILIYFAQNVFILMFGRFLTGFCGGSITLAAPIFIAETSEPKFRGMLINGFEFSATVGVVFVSVIGNFCDWRTQALICSFVPLEALIVLYFIPESPRFLLFKGREEEAFESLCWFRGASKDEREKINRELKTLMKNMNEDTRHLEERHSFGFAGKWRELTSLPVLKSFFLILSLFFFEEMSGVAAMDFYIVDILESATTKNDPYNCCIIIHIVEIIFSACSGFLMDRINRKFLTVFSESLMMMSLGLMGTFFYVKEQHPEWVETNLTFIPAISVAIFYVGFVSGIATVPLILMPELLPQRVRGVASSLLLTLKWTMSFLVSRFFKNYMSAVGNAFGYFTFASICFVGLIFGLIFLPKTSGKSLEQIQIEMNHKNTSKSKNKSTLNSDSQTQL